MVECQLPKLRTRVRFPSLALLLGFLGCTTVGPQSDYCISNVPQLRQSGVYHKIKRGETLWRIAKVYDVPLNDIIEANNMPSAAQVEENQLVFIPGAQAVKDIILETDKSDNDFIWPLEGKVINYFGSLRDGVMNRGIDIQTNSDSAVKASRMGRVVFADRLSGYGEVLILDHSDGFYTVYANNAKINVQLDDLVVKGQEIAEVGRKGNKTYLHFEIRKDQVENNPLHYLP